jgi:acetylornithine deacetylase/succinyl-diaminopimelate desuccinylase-like protein
VVTQQWFVATGGRLGNETHYISNVLVRTGRGDPSRRVLLGAHFDSVDEGPGPLDEGGAAVLDHIHT